MRVILLGVSLMLCCSSWAMAEEMEAGKGDIAIPAGICQGTTGEEIKKTFYANGSLDVKANCKDGKINGIVKKYTDAGKIRMKAEYTNDQLNGVAKIHDASGSIVYRDEYENGVRKTHMRYDEKGELVPVK